MKYYIWTAGCQMNVSDSRRVASALELLGLEPSENKAKDADVIVLNTCVVRQSAEDKAYGFLNSLKPLKKKNPELVICLMGCLVGIRNNHQLENRFPFVDVFAPPSDPGPLVTRLTQNTAKEHSEASVERQNALLDGEILLPENEQGNLVSAYISIVLGCSHACSYCIIPYRRGAEKSRDPQSIFQEAESLVRQGVREITLLGQIVDLYGKEFEAGPKLPDLLEELHKLENLERLRFLTSHPNWMNERLLRAVAELPKVMPHIEVPIQAGDDVVLENMRRGYTVQDYRDLVQMIREIIPNASIATDIIVGFPGETEAQFQNTYDLLADLKLDVAHLARYSSRPGTLATRKMVDDVTEEEKWRRFRLLEELQARIAEEINAGYLGKTVHVLFEDKVRGRWRGRTETNKLVFLETEEQIKGKVLPVEITWTGPWSMQSHLPVKLVTRQ
ncbi:MAG: tRNA (N6-isopentenyl adenosine(37)-C2)-methylthiotransferase MiaB [Anaerolineales bacterium]|nr:tRNA (N6-isopentenyl adenosine(37)-C2)-methylthiotransferase MiaB [Anaerolineales bacterium]